MRAADMPPIMSDQSSSTISTAPSIRVNAVRRHLKAAGSEHVSGIFNGLNKRWIVIADPGSIHARRDDPFSQRVFGRGTQRRADVRPFMGASRAEPQPQEDM